MIPKTTSKASLDSETRKFISENPTLSLGARELAQERKVHTEVFGFASHPRPLQANIGKVEFLSIRGPYGTIPLRVLYPSKPALKYNSDLVPALIYIHGGGYSVGTADDFENGCRILAEKARVQVYLPDYRLAPEWAYPVQLNEYEFVLDWLRGEGGKERAVDVNSIFGAGDSAGGNMSASLCLRLKSKRKEPLAGLLLLYPEPRLPFDTPAATDSNSGPYLECNGIFSFAHNYIPNGVSPSHPEITPGAQHVDALRDFPPTAIHTCGFDCLRDVGVEFASNLEKAGNRVFWRHHETLCHGFLQMAPWSAVAMKALEQGADDVRTMLGSYGYEGYKTD
ncbi:hypothetical protein N7497_012261 [Penicillium chrysogenum]|uniref:Alpha/beta hydrolase fold-3 domain-containing protein n=1 Tax=Penicillium chrysogenum TaxID=5076 RepID=A0ABQ8W9T1_PENCH|nr:hypothetical protein N7505_009779 [Penicillium chrysogenum]KAJ6137009.1 hypothetical protein N7497_012261 [Penicillium chrysogenum]